MTNSTEITLPPEWDDDDRMNFLFSEFKENRDVNTKDWDSKMDFWTSLITQSCRDRGAVCVNLQELNKVFRRKGTSPLGLGTVIQCMARSVSRSALCTVSLSLLTGHVWQYRSCVGACMSVQCG